MKGIEASSSVTLAVPEAKAMNSWYYDILFWLWVPVYTQWATSNFMEAKLALCCSWISTLAPLLCQAFRKDTTTFNIECQRYYYRGPMRMKVFH